MQDGHLTEELTDAEQHGLIRQFDFDLALGDALQLGVERGRHDQVAIDVADGGADLVQPNPALQAWIEQQTGVTAEDVFVDDNGEDPWREISEILGIPEGTVKSQSYPIEIAKFFPSLEVTQEACPMWVPLIENNEQDSEGADYFVQKHLHTIFSKSSSIDLLLLACTHYPLLRNKIEKFLPAGVQVLSQGDIVASSLVDYLGRHPEMASRCTQQAQLSFFTTDNSLAFDKQAAHFFGRPIQSKEIQLGDPCC